MIAPRDDRACAGTRLLGDKVELSVPSRTVDGTAAQLIKPPIAVAAAMTASTRPTEGNCPRDGMEDGSRREVVPRWESCRRRTLAGEAIQTTRHPRPLRSSDERTHAGATSSAVKPLVGGLGASACHSRSATIGPIGCFACRTIRRCTANRKPQERDSAVRQRAVPP